jgi:hypothetical protein
MTRPRPALLGGRHREFHRETVVWLQDNVRPHSAQVTQQSKLAGKYYIEIGWEILPHPANSPDLFPRDFNLFEPMKETLRGKHLAGNDKV